MSKLKNRGILNEIEIFLESFEEVSELAFNIKSKLSLDDIYYIEYCKVKAERFIAKMDTITNSHNSLVTELGLLRRNIEIVISQINMVEKLHAGRGIDRSNKVDSKMMSYDDSVRKAGNIIYYNTYVTSKRDITVIYDILGYWTFMGLIGVGIYCSKWDSIINVAETFTVLSCVYACIIGLSGKAFNKYCGKYSLKKSYESKKIFIYSILTKIIAETNKYEYMYLLNDINNGIISCDNKFQVCYAFAKIESLGEYLNEHSRDKVMDRISELKHNNYIETQLRSLHDLANSGGIAWKNSINTK